MRASWIILILLCASLCCLASGTGDDGDGAASRKSSQSDGEFHAWLVHPEHVFEANLMQLRVRLFPNTNGFPGMRKADVNRFDDTVVQATIALGGHLGAVVEHTDREPSAVASPAREGTGSGGTRILSACDFECVGAAGGCAAVCGFGSDGALSAGAAR